MAVEKVRIPLSRQRGPLVIDGLEHRASLDFRVTARDLERASDELGETDEIREKCLEKLKNKLKTDNGLRSRLDDEFLLRYLRFRKFDCDRAYNTIQNFYLTRHKQPELFSLPSNLKSLLESNIVRWLPYRSEDGCEIFLVDFGLWNLDEISIYDTFVMTNALADVITVNPSMQIQGIIGIWNMRGFTCSHATHILHPHKLQFLANILQNLYPWRIKRIYGIYCNAFINTAFKTIFLFLKKKIRDRFVLLGSDLTELHQYVKPELLPKELGGAIEESECDIADIVMENFPYIKYERSFGYITKD